MKSSRIPKRILLDNRKIEPDLRPQWSVSGRSPTFLIIKKLDRETKKKIHQVGQLPLYLRKKKASSAKWGTFQELNKDDPAEDTAPEPEEQKLDVPQTDLKCETFAEEQNKDSTSAEELCNCGHQAEQVVATSSEIRRNPTDESQSGANMENITQSKHVDAAADKCIEEFSNSEQQIESLLSLIDEINRENQMLREQQNIELQPLLDTLKSCESLQMYSKQLKDPKHLAREELKQNMLYTLNHLEFQSIRNKKTISELRVYHKLYRGQINELHASIHQYHTIPRCARLYTQRPRTALIPERLVHQELPCVSEPVVAVVKAVESFLIIDKHQEEELLEFIDLLDNDAQRSNVVVIGSTSSKYHLLPSECHI
ncbi:uncharacterized protein LOC129766192 [Toxorhynchites rutilus septentrionalis]|uniref:uncharacterized protein LOC129766192 n=1 Tax=Toxorhynchites rutilus septentrionalis TaxID=329112 RepID=UPI00247A20B3|nr:uncharacterized protein LOC129766192 [Toxorhynchites rutilus septentrionalis]